MKFKSLTPNISVGVELVINAEKSISESARNNLLLCLAWILDAKTDNNTFVTTLGVAKPAGPSFVLQTTLKELRSELRTQELQLTIYKCCYIAALLSSRTEKELFKVLEGLRDQLAIANWEAGIIHDALLGECDLMTRRCSELPDPCRLSIVGLCCLLLRVDNSTHVLETEMLRLVTANLRLGQVSPSALLNAMGRKPAVIFAELDADSKPWALLQIGRMASSDGVLRPKEAQFIAELELEEKIEKSVVQLIQKTISIETGIRIL